MLPQRVVGILHRQGRYVRHLPVAPRRIGAREIACQRRQRPAVAGDVVHQQRQHVLARPVREQMRPQRQLAGKIEALARRLRQSVRQARLGDGCHRELRPRCGRIQDQLAGDTERLGEHGAQGLVPRDQVAERGVQRRNIERAREPHRHRDRVVGALVTVTPPSSRCRNHSRRCANDSGISAGRATGTVAGRAACAWSTRLASASTVGASNRLRIAISTSRVARSG